MDPSDNTTEAALVEANSCPMGVQLVNAKRTNKGFDPQLTVAMHQADNYTKANAGNKLTIIADQMRYLQAQAAKVLEDASRDNKLHHAACNFVKKPGTIYSLYERPSGQTYFSIMSPEEWGASCPHEFLGAYRLEYDQSWTPVEDLEKRDRDMALINQIVYSKRAAITGPSSTAEILGFQKIKDVSSTSDNDTEMTNESIASPDVPR